MLIVDVDDDDDDDNEFYDDNYDNDDEYLGCIMFSFSMAKYADRSNEDLASAFIVGTCQLIPRSSLVHSDHMRNLSPTKSPATAEYSIMCGSNEEFYIRPLNSCIGDVDRLIAQANELVFSGDFPVLPSDLSGLPDTIVCYKIEQYNRYPGFVRLRV